MKPTEIQKICRIKSETSQINLKAIYNKKARAIAEEQPENNILDGNKPKIIDSFLKFKTSGYDCDDVFILFNDYQIEDMKFHCLNINVTFAKKIITI